MNNSPAFDHSYDSVSAPVPQVQHQITAPPPRKRGRQPEQGLDPKVAAKRAKAAERQRRKRERDRRATVGAMSTVPQPVPGPSVPIQPPPPPPQPAEPPQLTKEEEERREKVRAAARERQRKHRALVKQRKMAELGLAMGENGMLPEEVHYALQPDGQYQPVLPPNAHAQPPEMGNPENQYQPGAGQTGGQTFASTLLLSLSCSPLLKAHLLRSLSMTNEELCSLEPILSAAWDQWDHARRLHYAEQVAQAGRQQQQHPGDQQQHSEQQQQQQQQPQQNGPSPSNPAAAPPPNPFGPHSLSEQHDPNDFRSRFHRPLTAPSPFGTIPMPGAPGQIDPNLNGTTSSTSFAEAVAKVAMAANANGQNVHHAPNGLVDGDVDAEGGSASDDAEIEATNSKEDMRANAMLNDKRDS